VPDSDVFFSAPERGNIGRHYKLMFSSDISRLSYDISIFSSWGLNLFFGHVSAEFDSG